VHACVRAVQQVGGAGGVLQLRHVHGRPHVEEDKAHGDPARQVSATPYTRTPQSIDRYDRHVDNSNVRKSVYTQVGCGMYIRAWG
jgi:hypothetical protein